MALGLWFLWRRERDRWSWADSGRALVGWMLAGWGLFNLVEGVVDHHILTIHHVRDDVADPLPWDLGFLGFGLLLVVAGLLLVRWGRSTTATTAAERTAPRTASNPRPTLARGANDKA